jgi:hypothetical protein
MNNMNIKNTSGVMGHYKITIKDSEGNYKSLWQENALGKLLGIQIPGVTGKYTTEYTTKNLIVDAGLNALCKRASGEAQDEFKWIALGIEDLAEQNDQTALEGEITDDTHSGRGLERAVASVNVTTNKLTLEKEFTVTGTATNIAIKEVGVFSQLAVGGTMLSRTVITTKNVDTGDKITITYELTLARV